MINGGVLIDGIFVSVEDARNGRFRPMGVAPNNKEDVETEDDHKEVD